DLKMQGHTFDDITGNIDLSDAFYTNSKDTYEFEKLNLNSSFKEDIRKISVNSPDIINGEVKGKFVLGEVEKLFRNAIGNLYSNYKPFEIMEDQHLRFDIAIHNKIVEALFPEINLSHGTTLRGEVRSSNSNVKLSFKSPEIKVYDNKLENIDLQLDNTNPLFATYFNVDSISTPYYNLSKTNFVSNRRSDTLHVRTYFKGGKENKDEFNVNLFYTFNEENQSVLGIKPSDVTFRNNTWQLNEENKENTIVFDNKFQKVQTDTLWMTHENQKIAFMGSKGGTDQKNFKLDFSEVDLNKIAPSLEDFAFEGIINGGLEVNQQEGI